MGRSLDRSRVGWNTVRPPGRNQPVGGDVRLTRQCGLRPHRRWAAGRELRPEQQNRPKLVDVELSDGTCAELALEDTAAIQTVDVKGQGITSVTVSVVTSSRVSPPRRPLDW